MQEVVRLLLVEDHERVRAVLSAAFTDRGYTVIASALNGGGYVHALQHRPAIIVLSASGGTTQDAAFVERLHQHPATRSIPILAPAGMNTECALPGTVALKTPLRFETLIHQVESMLMGHGVCPPPKPSTRRRRQESSARRVDPDAPPVDPQEAIVDRIATWCGKLPIHPGSAAAIARVASEDACDEGELIRIFEGDPGFAAAVLKLVNATAYACRGRKVGDVREAVVRLGLGNTRRLALSLAIVSPVARPPAGDFPLDCRRAWTHALAVAVLADELAVRTSTSDLKDAFLAGLLHNLGLFLLANVHGSAYRRSVIEERRSGKDLCDLEKAAFGIDHATLVGKLLARWRFPETLTRAVGACHEPLALKDNEDRCARQLAALVYVADRAADAIGYGLFEDAGAPEVPAALWEILHLPPQDPQGLLAVVERNLADWAAQLQLGTPIGLPQPSEDAPRPAVRVLGQETTRLCMKELACAAGGFTLSTAAAETTLYLSGVAPHADVSGRIVALVEGTLPVVDLKVGPVIRLPDAVPIPKLLEALRLAV